MAVGRLRGFSTFTKRKEYILVSGLRPLLNGWMTSSTFGAGNIRLILLHTSFLGRSYIDCSLTSSVSSYSLPTSWALKHMFDTLLPW